MLRVQGEQLVKGGPKPLKVIFTELAVGLENDWHCCPQVQLVITLKGNWCGPVFTNFLILTRRLEMFLVVQSTDVTDQRAKGAAGAGRSDQS